jgi:hypothetical protein
LDYDWPGNVRELVNIINRGVILCKDSQLNCIHLGLFPKIDRVNAVASVESGQNLLQQWLANMVSLSLASAALPPLGQWLEEDIILACLLMHGDVLNRAAASLAVPESTLRRKVLRIRELYGADTPQRPDGWHAATPLLAVLSQFAEEQQTPLLDIVSQYLLVELENRPISRKAAATLLGVSIPTYRRLSA